MGNVARIQIDLQDAAGGLIQRMSFGTGLQTGIKYGDEVDVAFIDQTTIDFRITWRRMRVIRHNACGLLVVRDEIQNMNWHVHSSRVRRAEK